VLVQGDDHCAGPQQAAVTPPQQRSLPSPHAERHRRRAFCRIRMPIFAAITSSYKRHPCRMALFMKIILLSFMATIFFLASNMQAFFFMNQFELFRKVRNFTVFFFLFVGQLAASLFAWMSGQEKKPSTDQIHQATVLIMEALTLGLLLSTFITLYGLVTNYMNDRARKKLKDANHRLAQVALSIDALNPLPGFPVSIAAAFPPPQEPALPSNPIEAAKYVQDQTKYVQDLRQALVEAETQAGQCVHFHAVGNEVQVTCNRLLKKYSIFSTTTTSTSTTTITPDSQNSDSGLMRLVISQAETTSQRITTRIENLDTYITSIRGLLNESEEQKIRFQQRLKQITRATNQPHGNPLTKAVLICLLLTTVFMAYKNSQASPSKSRRTSPETQIALLENYFHTSEFSNYVQIVVLEIVGMYLDTPHCLSKFIASCFCRNIRSYFLHFRHLALPPTSRTHKWPTCSFQKAPHRRANKN
jgi:hypothetical protein